MKTLKRIKDGAWKMAHVVVALLAFMVGIAYYQAIRLVDLIISPDDE